MLKIEKGPFFHTHDNVDVAVFRVHDIDPRTPVLELGSHLNDWLGHGDFVLSEAIVLGYPPIPMARQPILIGARAEVNAQVDLYDTDHVHFILSSMPRGGFSGGVAVSEYGFALGVVTRSLTSNYSPVEMGFMTVVGVEPIYDCLAEHLLLPDVQAEGWDEFWNSSRLAFYNLKASSNMGGFLLAASLEIFDDGKKQAITIIFDVNPEALESALEAADSALYGYQCILSEIRPSMIRIDVAPQGQKSSAAVRAAGQAMSAAIMTYGYEPIPYFSANNPLLPPCGA